jgi:hypothetical protein
MANFALKECWRKLRARDSQPCGNPAGADAGWKRGGVPFTQGPLFYMLRNHFYIGEVNFKGEILPGP